MRPSQKTPETITTIGIDLGKNTAARRTPSWSASERNEATPKRHLLHSYCGAVAVFAIASSKAAVALTVASASMPNPCRFASQFGSL